MIFYYLTVSAGQELRQGTVGMACLCSLTSGVLAGKLDGQSLKSQLRLGDLLLRWFISDLESQC